MPAGTGFLSADAAAGAVIMKAREGHTWFSVNGHSGIGFKDNEGFYEFDVEIKWGTVPGVPRSRLARASVIPEHSRPTFVECNVMGTPESGPPTELFLIGRGADTTLPAQAASPKVECSRTFLTTAAIVLIFQCSAQK